MPDEVSMYSVSDMVQKVISEFVEEGVLFTALDVSNKVKETLPLTRHKEVRDLVRAAFHSEIESAGYARTPINVTLADGSIVEALLYHPLEDSWDLNSAYDSQKRMQTTVKPTTVTVPKISTTITKNSAPPVVIDPPSAKEVWEELFKSKPSIFSK